jgi:HD-GYP domain-containing protein (c-di-GMP phosphodiesterase class II)
MRYFNTKDLKPGMILGRSVYSEHNKLLLGINTELKDRFIRRIADMGISHVCIQEEGTDHLLIEDPIDGEIYRKAQWTLDKLFQTVIYEARRRKAKDKDGTVREMLRSRYVAPIHDLITSVRHIFEEYEMQANRSWDTLPQNFRPDTCYFHGVDVAILSILVGLKYNYKFDQISHLGLGAIMHDLGKAFMPQIAQKRRFELTLEEMEVYRKHPKYGVSLLEYHTRGHYVTKECLLQHHEQQDGEGFPQGLRGYHRAPLKDARYKEGEIYHYAEIVSVVNTYVNLTTGGWYEEPLSPDEALTMMKNEMVGSLNRIITSMLARVVVTFPTGSTVRITQCSSSKFVGHYAVVDTPNPDKPHQPVLVVFADESGTKIRPKRIDFSEEASMKIQLGC